MQNLLRFAKDAAHNVKVCRLLQQTAFSETIGSCALLTQRAPCRRSSSFMTVGNTRRYVPRRTLLYIPGHDKKKLRKIKSIGADCAVLECEDGVALNKKAEARENIRVMLDELGDVPGVDIAVRINSVSSGMMDDDLKVIMQAERRPDTILLPKVDTVDDVVLFTDRFRSAIRSRNEGYCPNLITYVESAEALMNLKDILKRASDFTKAGVYNLDAVVFGSDDFCADIGAFRTVDAAELTYARQKIVMVAKGYRIQAIDMVHIDYKDPEGLLTQAELGIRMGYTGKQVIHPNQVPIINQAFTPSPERVEWATELIAAFGRHQQSGQGAFIFRDNMIDRPLLLQAHNIVQMVANIKKI